MENFKNFQNDQRGFVALTMAMVVALVLTIMGVYGMGKAQITGEILGSGRESAETRYVLDAKIAESKKKRENNELSMGGLHNDLCWRIVDNNALDCGTGQFPLLIPDGEHPGFDHRTAIHWSSESQGYEAVVVVKNTGSGDILMKATIMLANNNVMPGSSFIIVNNSSGPLTTFPSVDGSYNVTIDPSPYTACPPGPIQNRTFDASLSSRTDGNTGNLAYVDDGSPGPTCTPHTVDPTPYESPVPTAIPSNFGRISNRICQNPSATDITQLTNGPTGTGTFETNCSNPMNPLSSAAAITVLSKDGYTIPTLTDATGSQTVNGLTANLAGTSPTFDEPPSSSGTGMASWNEARAMGDVMKDTFVKLYDYRLKSSAAYDNPSGVVIDVFNCVGSRNATHYAVPTILFISGTTSECLFNGPNPITGTVSIVVGAQNGAIPGNISTRTNVTFNGGLRIIGSLMLQARTQVTIAGAGNSLIIGDDTGGAVALVNNYDDPTWMPTLKAPTLETARLTTMPNGVDVPSIPWVIKNVATLKPKNQTRENAIAGSDFELRNVQKTFNMATKKRWVVFKIHDYAIY